MALKCDFCDKGAKKGQNITHHRGVAGGRWKRKAPKTKKLSQPNLQSAWLKINGVRVKKIVCTSCLRTFKKKQAQ